MRWLLWALLLVHLSFVHSAEVRDPVEPQALGNAVSPVASGLHVGFGTAAMRGQEAVEAVSFALTAGFRYIDTAHADEWYDESSIGIALKSSGISREQLHFTTKVHPADLDYESTKASVESSLERLQTDYIDSVLLHYASCGPHIPRCVEERKTGGDFVQAWRALEELHDGRVIGSIGVSNFDVGELQRLIATCRIKPQLVQDWADPYHQNQRLRRYLKAQKISKFTSYSTLGTQWLYQIGRNPVLDSEGPIERIARSHDSSAALVALSWALKRGMSVIPRSTNMEHIQELAALARGWRVPLTPEQLAEIDALDGSLLNP